MILDFVVGRLDNYLTDVVITTTFNHTPLHTDLDLPRVFSAFFDNTQKPTYIIIRVHGGWIYRCMLFTLTAVWKVVILPTLTISLHRHIGIAR